MSHFRYSDSILDYTDSLASRKLKSQGLTGVLRGEVAFLIVHDKDQSELITHPTHQDFLNMCEKYNFDVDRTLSFIEAAPDDYYGFAFDTSLYGKEFNRNE